MLKFYPSQTAYLINASKNDKLAVWASKLKGKPNKLITPAPTKENYLELEGNKIYIQGLKHDPDHTTRHGEHKVRSQGARDRRALTGEAGNASRRQVIVGATARSPEWASAWRTQDESGPNISHVMRTNFGDTRWPKFFVSIVTHLRIAKRPAVQAALAKEGLK